MTEQVRFRLGEQQRSALECAEPRAQAGWALEFGDLDDAEAWGLIWRGWRDGALALPNTYRALDGAWRVLVDQLNAEYERGQNLSAAGDSPCATGCRDAVRALDGLTRRILLAARRAPDCPQHLRSER